MALVQKMTRNIRHPMGLRHPVISMDTYIKTKKCTYKLEHMKHQRS